MKETIILSGLTQKEMQEIQKIINKGCSLYSCSNCVLKNCVGCACFGCGCDGHPEAEITFQERTVVFQKECIDKNIY